MDVEVSAPDRFRNFPHDMQYDLLVLEEGIGLDSILEGANTQGIHAIIHPIVVVILFPVEIRIPPVQLIMLGRVPYRMID